MNVETYVLGQGKVPSWLNDEAGKGRVKYIYDDDMKVIGAKIKSGLKEYTANRGDSIVKSQNGIVVVPIDRVKKNVVQKENKQEQKQSEEADD